MTKTPRNQTRSSKAQRGAATVEFALVAPLLITILMFSIFLTDLVRVKLKLQEAARFATWEMTSYLLTDYGNKVGESPDHDGAFDKAMNSTMTEVQTRYADLDSVEDSAGSGMVFDYEQAQVTMQNLDVPLINRPFGVGSGGFFQAVIDRVNGGLGSALNFWGFNPKGRVQAEVRMRVNNKFLAKDFYNDPEGFFTVDQHGGNDLSGFEMSSRLTMTASGWHLADGADQTINRHSGVGGDHNDGDGADGEYGGMWHQTKRMTFGGAVNLIESNVPFFDTLQQWLPLPDFFGTYVVSHNYMEGAEVDYGRTSGNSERNCNTASRNNGVQGFNGLHNLAPQIESHPRLLKTTGKPDILMRCFDTAPFRDTQSLRNSLYAQIYSARGEHFMGCTNPMADDPTRNQPYTSDKQNAATKAACSNIGGP